MSDEAAVFFFEGPLGSWDCLTGWYVRIEGGFYGPLTTEAAAWAYFKLLPF